MIRSVKIQELFLGGKNTNKKSFRKKIEFFRFYGFRILVVLTCILLSQELYAAEFRISPGSTIEIKGKSSLYLNWQSNSKSILGKVVMEKGINNFGNKTISKFMHTPEGVFGMIFESCSNNHVGFFFYGHNS